MLNSAVVVEILFLHWILSVVGAQGVLWSLLLSNPNLGDGTTPPKYSSNDQVVDVPARHNRHHHGMEFCSDDRGCKKDMFCDRHYGICDYLRKEGGHCRRDHQCEKGHECVFGLCRKHVKNGELGARCQTDSDCDLSMCCARHHGEHVCKSRLPVGHRCFIPKGGLDYAINEMCPCDAGLVCKVSPENSRFNEDIFVEHQSTYSNVRCSRPY